MDSLSGTVVSVEGILLENPNLALDRSCGELPLSTSHIQVPKGHLAGGVDPDTYDGYRRGLDSACADIVVCTWRDGEPVVLASKRARNKPFGGMWWMQGGAIHSYRSITDFVAERAEKEVGVRPTVEALIGVYRTVAEDHLASTTNLAFVGIVDPDELDAARADKDHVGWRLLSLSDLESLPEEERHWYPMRVFRLALTTMPPRR